VDTVGTNPREIRTGRALEQKDSLKVKNQWSGFAEEDREIPLTIGSGKKCARFSP
jgi:hypothetical protein